MPPKSGRLTLEGFGPDREDAGPVTAFRLDDHPDWEVVAQLRPDSTIGLLVLQPSGTFNPDYEAVTPATGITARLLRSLPIGEITAQATAIHRQAFAAAVGEGTAEGSYYHAWHKSLQQRPGRRGRPDEDYLDLVVAYADLVRNGDRTPVTAIAKSRHLATSTVRNLLHEARRRGLLTTSGQGRPGGSLTPKAVEMLRARSEKGAHHGQR